MASTPATSPAAPDLVVGLPEPTPDAVRALREGAGLSLAAITAALGVADRGTWARWERGERAMPAQTWALALLALGRHPAYCLAQPASGPQAPRSAGG